MAAEIDVYQNCPCGSGKKLKFCCHAIAGEMMKFDRMQANHQYALALQALEALEKKPIREAWSRAWIKTSRAWTLVLLGQLDEARDPLAEVLEDIPEHPLALALDGYIALLLDGYPAAGPAVYKAFRLAASEQPLLVADIATALAKILLNQNHVMAAREYFLLALKLALRVDPKAERFQKQLEELEGDRDFPYLLRGEYAPRPLADPVRFQSQVKEAEELSALGCWNYAAKQYRTVAQQEPNDPAAWFNIGLCDACAGNDPLAVEAFRVAARQEPDFESAVDCEGLAQVLAARGSKKKVNILGAEYRVHSVSKLLTLLDQVTFLVRYPTDPDADGPQPAGRYILLDRDPASVPDDQLTLETIATSLGSLLVTDADSAKQVPASARLLWIETEAGNNAQKQIVAMAGSEIEPIAEPETLSSRNAEQLAVTFEWYFPPTVHPTAQRRLERLKWQQIVDDVWPNLKLEALGGKTPLEAAGVEELRVALAGAVLAFEVFAETREYSVDQDLLRSRLGLPPVAPLPVDKDADVDRLSLLQTRRLPFPLLTDAQFMAAAGQIMVLGHAALSYQILRETLVRPGMSDAANLGYVYMRLAQLCRERHQREEALVWIGNGRQLPPQGTVPLKELFLWDLQELSIRAEDPQDPLLPPLAHRVWQTYSRKLPEFRELIAMTLSFAKLEGPWNQSVAATSLEPASTAEGIWTPEAQAVGGGTSKLWLPGQ